MSQTNGCLLLHDGAVAPGPGERASPRVPSCAPRARDGEIRAASGRIFFNRPARARGGAPEAGALPETHRSEVIRKSKTFDTMVSDSLRSEKIKCLIFYLTRFRLLGTSVW